MDLPDDLDLPLASGADWWYWLGGRPALDFVNTRRERWWRDVETLVTPSDLGRWLVAAGLAGPDPPAGTRAQLRSARELRESIDRALVACISAKAPRAADLRTIDAHLADAHLPDRLLPGPGGAAELRPGTAADPVSHGLGLLAGDAAQMLGTDERGRLRVCASETCSCRFYDHSRAASRRWCSMSGCGNVAKARRHRARHSVAG
jgi:predicted RNA-binding Zn ribbon-like protein